jgi:Flp pilus assembly pilin Flp
MAAARSDADIETMQDERRLTVKHQSHRTLEDQSGQTLAEYTVVLSVISLGIVAALTVLSGSVLGSVQAVASIVGG